MEQNIYHNQKANRKTLLCVLILVVFFILLLCRAPYGYDWTDESDYLSLPYRLLMFDRPLVDTWEVHQISAVITIPLVALFRVLSDGTDGILLFTRYCFLACQMLVSVYVFFLLRRRSEYLAAFFSAAFFLGYAHFSINSLYYNTYVLLFLTIAALLALDVDNRGLGVHWRLFLSGMAFALSVQAQPYALLALLVWAAYWLDGFRSKRAGIKKGFLLWVGGIAIIALGFILYVILRTPVGEILPNVKGMLSDPSYPKIHYLEQIGKYLNAIRVEFSPFSYAAAALLVYSYITSRVKNEKKKCILRLVGLACAVCVILGASAVVFTRDLQGVHRINMIAMAPALAAPGLYFLGSQKRKDLAFFFFLGLALSVATQYGSNTRFLASSGMLVLSSVAAIGLLFDGIHQIKGELETEMEFSGQLLRTRKALLVSAVASLALILSALFYLRMTVAYRDDSILGETRVIEEGPARGLRTSSREADKYEELISDILKYAPAQGNILVTNLFPDAYMLTNLTPAAPGEFNMSVDFIAQYYKQHPERLPDYIFAIDESYGMVNELSDEIAEAFTANGTFQQFTAQSGKAFIRLVD